MASPELESIERDEDRLLRELQIAGAVLDGNDKGHLHCPWHGEDKSGSLSVFTDKDSGKAMFKCHGPCDMAGTIVQVRMRLLNCDYATAAKSLENGNRFAAPKAQPKKNEPEKEQYIWESHDVLLSSRKKKLSETGFTYKTTFKYINPDDDVVEFTIDRFNKVVDGKVVDKTIRPSVYLRDKNGWVSSLPKGFSKPIYRRKEIKNEDTVVVVEGEGKVDLLLSIGIPATCSPMGAKAGDVADWSPVSGKKIVFWRDNDKAGLEYQDLVRGELEKLGNKGNLWAVRIEKLHLGESEDVIDYVNAMKAEGSSEEAIELSVLRAINTSVRIGELEKGSTLRQLASYDVINDPTTLLGNRWLCQGGSAFINGQTGIGKSTLAMQMAVTWATGKSFFGIHPIKPLKSMFIQAENDKGDLAEQAQGVMKGMNIIDDIDDYNDNLLLFDEDELAGDGFLQRLEYLTSIYRPDLIFIDPLHAYIGGDLNDAAVCSKFLRRGLNPIAHRHKCAIFVVHHTKKPSADIIKKFSMGDYSYFGAGSAELGNWPRAIVILRELEEADKQGEGFQLIASKRGKRAGLSVSETPFDGSQAGTQVVVVKHSPVGLCWLPREEQKPPEDESAQAQKLDAQIAAEDVYRAMAKNQNYNEKELRELFMTVHSLKRTRRTELYDSKRRWGAAWKMLTDNVPTNPQMKWCYMRVEDAFPEPEHPAAPEPPSDKTHNEQAEPETKELFDEAQPK